jgi:putative tricarboxylic transport membrane protein
MRIINIITGILFLLLSVFIFVSTFFFKQTLIADMFLGATFFPRIVAGFMAVLSGMLITGQFSPAGKADTRTAGFFFNRKILKPVTVILFLAVYLVLLDYLGFFIPTVALFWSVLLLFKEHKKSYYITGIIFIAVIELIFARVFQVQLPAGIVGF